MCQIITKNKSRPNAPPPQTTQNNVAQPIDTAGAPVCFYHQTFGDRARTCREPCAFSLNQSARARQRLLHLAK